MRLGTILPLHLIAQLQHIAAAQSYTLNTGKINGKAIKPIRRGQSAWLAKVTR